MAEWLAVHTARTQGRCRKAVAVEAISDELMSRFDVSATYGYDFAEAAMNRIEAMAKELERGEQE